MKVIYVTGDTHGNFDRIDEFCDENSTQLSDIMIVLGDAGINYYGGKRDYYRKDLFSGLNITLFCIHGNHEQRPFDIPSYVEIPWHGGIVYQEPEFPKFVFAKDGEIYDFDGKKTIVLGGAYSIDKEYRLFNDMNWWDNEQPSDEIKAYAEQRLAALNWNIDVVLSHTVPLKYEPVESEKSDIDQSKIDKSTEQWLDSIENRLSYDKWYCGHWHIEKKIDKIEFMYENISEFLK